MTLVVVGFLRETTRDPISISDQSLQESRYTLLEQRIKCVFTPPTWPFRSMEVGGIAPRLCYESCSIEIHFALPSCVPTRFSLPAPLAAVEYKSNLADVKTSR